RPGDQCHPAIRFRIHPASSTRSGSRRQRPRGAADIARSPDGSTGAKGRNLAAKRRRAASARSGQPLLTQHDFVPTIATARREAWHSSATSDATDYRGSPHMAEDTLDCSDLDRYLGKPMQPARLREPLGNNDIRRWVQAMHYPNRLHYEDEFAAESRFGGI